MRISDWSSDVCSSDLGCRPVRRIPRLWLAAGAEQRRLQGVEGDARRDLRHREKAARSAGRRRPARPGAPPVARIDDQGAARRSEEHTSELQSLMRISYAVFCLKKKKPKIQMNKPEK